MKNDKENTIDLFENIPIEIENICEKWTSDDDLDYEKCELFLKELNKVGYTFEYYLDARPFNLIKF